MLCVCFILFAFVQRNEVLPMRAFRTVTVSFDGGETERELDKEEEKLFDEWVSKINSTCDSNPSIFVLYEKDNSKRQFRISENAKKAALYTRRTCQLVLYQVYVRRG